MKKWNNTINNNNNGWNGRYFMRLATSNEGDAYALYFTASTCELILNKFKIYNRWRVLGRKPCQSFGWMKNSLPTIVPGPGFEPWPSVKEFNALTREATNRVVDEQQLTLTELYTIIPPPSDLGHKFH